MHHRVWPHGMGWMVARCAVVVACCRGSGPRSCSGRQADAACPDAHHPTLTHRRAPLPPPQSPLRACSPAPLTYRRAAPYTCRAGSSTLMQTLSQTKTHMRRSALSSPVPLGHPSVVCVTARCCCFSTGFLFSFVFVFLTSPSPPSPSYTEPGLPGGLAEPHRRPLLGDPLAL